MGVKHDFRSMQGVTAKRKRGLQAIREPMLDEFQK